MLRQKNSYRNGIKTSNKWKVKVEIKVFNVIKASKSQVF